MSEIEDIFQETINAPDRQSFADKIVEQIENEIEGKVAHIEARENEKKEINEQIAKLRSKLRRVRNTNPRKQAANKKNSDTRERIRGKIRNLRMRLDEIGVEEGRE